MKKCILFQKSDAFRCFVLLVYWEDEKAYSADGNGADKRSAEKGGNLVSKFTDLQGAGGGAGFGQEGGNYNGLGWGEVSSDWLANGSCPGTEIHFLRTQFWHAMPPTTNTTPWSSPVCNLHLHFTFTFFIFTFTLFIFIFFRSNSGMQQKHHSLSDHDHPPVATFTFKTWIKYASACNKIVFQIKSLQCKPLTLFVH